MATIIKKNPATNENIVQNERAADNSSEGMDQGVEVQLSDRDRDILLAALNSSCPNRALQIAAEKYKKQCD